MKTRLGFVSNSSSSSFILLAQPPEGIEYVKVPQAYIKDFVAKMNRRLKKDEYYDGSLIEWDGESPIYITQLVSDSCDESWEKVCEEIPYFEGNHAEPYMENKHYLMFGDDWSDTVYIPKKDFVSKTRTLRKVINAFKKVNESKEYRKD